MITNNLSLPIAFFTIVSLPTHQALAIDCYDTIDTAVTLAENLECELSQENPYALIVTDPAGRLRMTGEGGITCTGNELGAIEEFAIFVEGSGNQVFGGKVDNCPGGILLGGTGSHIVYDTEVSEYFEHEGIRSDSDNNIIQSSVINGDPTRSGGDGIEVNGDFTNVSLNRIIGAGQEGIQIEGDFVYVAQNYITGSDDDGIDLEGLNGTIVLNTSEENDDDGILIETSDALVIQNISSFNGDEGLEIDDAGTNNILQLNTANNNESNGISIDNSGTEGNTIRDNTALNNSEFDLNDPFADPLCVGLQNNWGNNQANTSNPDCLRFLP
ncbi:right-handed parallel beta-helix repeat-containing protein [Microbulbifer sp. ANSA005]|uniref:right-handed parallel beta-helix repeat-containing protein n=1 Tax=Microbulbifer sp. ANSA005 TaxID=3243362 RepID=UPI004042C1EE